MMKNKVHIYRARPWLMLPLMVLGLIGFVFLGIVGFLLVLVALAVFGVAVLRGSLVRPGRHGGDMDTDARTVVLGEDEYELLDDKPEPGPHVESPSIEDPGIEDGGPEDGD